MGVDDAPPHGPSATAAATTPAHHHGQLQPHSPSEVVKSEMAVHNKTG